MQTDPAKSVAEKAVSTIFFYLLAAVAIYFLNESSPCGPCTPGFGFLGFMLLPVISVGLFVRNLVNVRRGDRASVVSAMLHFVLIIGFIIYLMSA